MSLRSYLFSLIGSLIVLLTITQLFLVYWIEQNLNKEVNVQARHISEQVLELAFKVLDKDGEHETKIGFIAENINADAITVITKSNSGCYIFHLIGSDIVFYRKRMTVLSFLKCSALTLPFQKHVKLVSWCARSLRHPFSGHPLINMCKSEVLKCVCTAIVFSMVGTF